MYIIFSLTKNGFQISRAGELPFFDQRHGGEQCLPRIPTDVPTSKLVKVRFYLEHGPLHNSKRYVSASFLDVTLV